MQSVIKQIIKVITAAVTTAVLIFGCTFPISTAHALSSINSSNQASEQLSLRDIELVDAILFDIGPAAVEIGNSIESLFAEDEFIFIQEYIEKTRKAFIDTKAIQVKSAVDLLRSGTVNLECFV